MPCHHINLQGLQILVDTREPPTKYKCLLCNNEFSESEYRELILEIKQRKDNNTLEGWRTINGDLQKVEEDE